MQCGIPVIPVSWKTEEEDPNLKSSLGNLARLKMRSSAEALSSILSMTGRVLPCLQSLPGGRQAFLARLGQENVQPDLHLVLLSLALPKSFSAAFQSVVIFPRGFGNT